MKTNKSQHLALVALVIVFVLISSTSYAQFDFDDIDFDDGGGISDETVAPITGLIALGLAVGGYLGIRQIRKQD
jgi:hypothetical protein